MLSHRGLCCIHGQTRWLPPVQSIGTGHQSTAARQTCAAGPHLSREIRLPRWVTRWTPLSSLLQTLTEVRAPHAHNPVEPEIH